MRRVRKSGGRVIRRRNGTTEIHGPCGFYLLHTSMSAGAPQHLTVKHIRRYTGLDV